MSDKPKFCRDCKWSMPKPKSEWDLRCMHPATNADDAWALADTTIRGSDARAERARGWFAPCGKQGRLWEPKP